MMNSHEEKELCALLLKNGPNSEAAIPDYPRLQPDVVNDISKNLTTIIYDSMKNENATSQKNRETVISLLTKWSRNYKYGSHITVNEKNRRCFLKCLNKSEERHNDLFSDFYEESKRENLETNLWKDIFKSLQDSNKLNLENKMSIDLIQALDNVHLKKTGFLCNVPTKIIQRNDFDKSLSSLKEITNFSEDYKCNSPLKNHLQQRSSKVAFGYSLLTVERNNDDNELLKNVIQDIVKKDEKNDEEINFITYIWNNQDKLSLPPEMLRIILEGSPFLYEKPILKLATEIMSTCEDKYVNLIRISNLNKILLTINLNSVLYHNILSCVFELYHLCNFDTRVHQLILDIIEIVENVNC